MDASNRVVHGLWIGRELSPLELLCLHSFVFHQHEFHLWLYDELSNPVPEGVVIREAEDIMPRSSIFSYRSGYHRGSFAGFSDIFRYRLLYEYGGWWADMDICCLKPLDASEPYLFREHDRLPCVGNIMKCPPQSRLMKLCYEQAVASIDENNEEWLKPVRILNQRIQEEDLAAFIRRGFSNIDQWDAVGPLVQSLDEIPARWYVIHWCNEILKKHRVDKWRPLRGSTLEALLQRFQVPPVATSSTQGDRLS